MGEGFRTAGNAARLTRLVWSHPMSRAGRSRAVVRLWRWQLHRRLRRTPVVVELADGSVLRCPAWSGLAATLVSVGWIEATEVVFTLTWVRAGDTVVDVGANLGLYSVLAARRGARVIAFEPAAAAARMVRENAALNGAGDRVRVETTALADVDGGSAFTTGEDLENHLVAGPAGAGSEWVATTRLDSWLARSPGAAGERVALIKIDAEGFDLPVLRGAAEMLDRDRPVVIVEVWAGGRELRGWLEERGYGVYRFDLDQRRLEPVPAFFDGQANFIAVHGERLEATHGRLAAAAAAPVRPPRVSWSGAGDNRASTARRGPSSGHAATGDD